MTLNERMFKKNPMLMMTLCHDVALNKKENLYLKAARNKDRTLITFRG